MVPKDALSATQDTIQKKADVHFTPEGSKQMGEDVAKVIREKLAK